MILENPISFFSEKKHLDKVIKLTELMEIGQGGPEVGRLLINEKKILQYLFGGPFLCKNDYVYLPVYLKSFFYKGFKIAKININNQDVKILGNYENLINVYKIDEDFIYYYTDMDGTISRKLKL